MELKYICLACGRIHDHLLAFCERCSGDLFPMEIPVERYPDLDADFQYEDLYSEAYRCDDTPILPKDGNYIHCPNCSTIIEVVELNCRIFRCFMLSNEGMKHLSYSSIPHATREDLESWQSKGYSFGGCLAPFQVDASFKSSILYKDGKWDYTR